MTQVSADDVRHLAQLSSLQLSDDQVKSLQTDISNILGYVAQLDELDTENVVPTYQVTDLENVWREDEVVKSDVTREQLLGLTREAQDHQVKVPKVL
jgi:aspartyl-tRNA(Asn)/glutamyl-tRNA(Gln) amidotransferase subunit C